MTSSMAGVNVTRMTGSECLERNLELNAGSNRKPMKMGYHRCDVIVFYGHHDSTC